MSTKQAPSCCCGGGCTCGGCVIDGAIYPTLTLSYNLVTRVAGPQTLVSSTPSSVALVYSACQWTGLVELPIAPGGSPILPCTWSTTSPSWTWTFACLLDSKWGLVSSLGCGSGGIDPCQWLGSDALTYNCSPLDIVYPSAITVDPQNGLLVGVGFFTDCWLENLTITP